MASTRPRRAVQAKAPKSYSFKHLFSSIEDTDAETTQSTDAEEMDVHDHSEPEDEFRPHELEEEAEQEDEFIDDDMVYEEEDEEDDEVISVENLPLGEAIIEVDYSDPEQQMEDVSLGPGKRKRGKGKREAEPSTLRRSFAPGNIKPPSQFTRGTGLPQRTEGVNKQWRRDGRERGIEDFGKGGLERRLKDFFSPNHEELKPVLLTRDKWGSQETLPSRSEESLRRSYFVSQEGREKEIKVTRKWYADVGRDTFTVGQKREELNEQEGRSYLANPGPPSLNVVMGDIKNPQLYTLDKGSYMSTAAPFSSDTDRQGWIFNLGSRIQDAQWAPNEEGCTQYLAVAVQQNPTSGRLPKPLENPKAPAFTATKPFSASIQIWAFDSLENDSLDHAKPPRLEQVICTDWGAPTQFRWWPIGAADSVEMSHGAGIVHLGLLAGIWSDGKVRILDVSHQKSESNTQQPRFMRYSRAAFEVAMPNCVPSCLHWLGGTTFAVGTASGALAVWTLTRPGIFPPSDAMQVDPFYPRPWLYKQVADSYILTLNSGYPSKPQYVSITTGDGYAGLIDIRTPTADVVHGERGRMLILTHAWHEHTQSFIQSLEHSLLKHNTLRRYYANLFTMRMEHTITCCATSAVHPAILLGSVDGEVTASNPNMRVMNVRTVPWQLPWFKHEWRRPVERLASGDGQNGYNGTDDRGTGVGTALTSTANGNGSSPHPNGTAELSSAPQTGSLHAQTNITVPPSVLRQPLSRITEGYKPHMVSLQHPDINDRNKGGAKILTIFEEKSAITRLAWNPNLKYGTWAVAGMADGLLRVEDLGV